MITYCEKLSEPQKVQHFEIEPVLKRFKISPELANKVNPVRQLKDDVKAYKEAKKNLELILFNGKFSYRDKAGFVEGSGYIILDFDNLKSPTETRDRLTRTPYIYSVFQSVNGSDYKALAKVPKIVSDLEYKVYFNELCREWPELDKSGSDISRACFVTYDPNLYLNPNCETFTIKKENLQVKYWQKVEKALRKIEDAIDGERHQIRLKISRLFGGWVAQGDIEEQVALYLLQKAALKNTDSPLDVLTKTLKDGINDGKKSPLSLGDESRVLNSKIGLGKVYYNLEEVQEKVDDLIKNGFQRGVDVGFKCLQDIYTMKKKSTTYFYSMPAEGKSQMFYEIAINVAYEHGWNFAILSPETGDVEEVYAEIILAVLRKCMGDEIDPKEYQVASAFVRQHFYVIDPLGKEFLMQDLLDQVGALERQYEVTIDCISIDPLNYLDTALDGRREDIAQGKDLDLFLADAKKNNRHNVIITHVRDIPVRNVKSKGDEDVQYSYFPIATPNDIANGRMFFRKGFMMVCIYRPLTTDREPLQDDNGIPYPKNSVIFAVQKFKPKGTGSIGKALLQFDVSKNRYYEMIDGERCYAFEHLSKQSLPKIQPNNDFNAIF